MVHLVITKKVEHASSDYLWSKLAQYSDMTWHPLIVSSKDIGTIPDGSPNMIGAERVLVTKSGQELFETVTKWDEDSKFMALTIDKGSPPFASTLEIGFQVREEKDDVLVDVTVDLVVKLPFILFTPLFYFVLPKKLDSFAQGVADLKE